MEGYIPIKSVLIALAIILTATVARAIDELEVERCAIKAQDLDSQLEDDGSDLIVYVNDKLICAEPGDDVNCVRKDQEVKVGIAKMMEKLKQLGEAKGCAKNLYQLGAQSNDVKQAMVGQLRESVREIQSVLDEMNKRTRILFEFIIETAESEAKKLL